MIPAFKSCFCSLLVPEKRHIEREVPLSILLERGGRRYEEKNFPIGACMGKQNGNLRNLT